MTPIAHAIAKNAMLPAKKRKPLLFERKRVDMEDFISGVHCFECTDVLDIAFDLADSGKVKDMPNESLFLPAPKTWIEHKGEHGNYAWLLLEKPFRFITIIEGDDRFGAVEVDMAARTEEQHLWAGLLFAMLAIINTPQIVSRDTIEPHKGLSKLWRSHSKRAPLNSWTELKLRVAKPLEIDDGEAHAEFIGGKRALHFCRAHLRVRLGKLEFVTSHWRGDPSLGTKLTRYKVTA